MTVGYPSARHGRNSAWPPCVEVFGPCAVPALSTLQPNPPASARADDVRAAPDRAAPPPPPAPEFTRLRRWLPGDRRVWQAAGAVVLLLLAVGVVELLRPRDVYTGTNTVRTRAPAIDVPAEKTLCIPGLSIPAGTGRVELEFLGPAPRPRLDASLRIGSTTQWASVPGSPAPGKLDFAFARRPDAPAAVGGRFCVTPRGS